MSSPLFRRSFDLVRPLFAINDIKLATRGCTIKSDDECGVQVHQGQPHVHTTHAQPWGLSFIIIAYGEGIRCARPDKCACKCLFTITLALHAARCANVKRIAAPHREPVCVCIICVPFASYTTHFIFILARRTVRTVSECLFISINIWSCSAGLRCLPMANRSWNRRDARHCGFEQVCTRVLCLCVCVRKYEKLIFPAVRCERARFGEGGS